MRMNDGWSAMNDGWWADDHCMRVELLGEWGVLSCSGTQAAPCSSYLPVVSPPRPLRGWRVLPCHHSRRPRLISEFFPLQTQATKLWWIVGGSQRWGPAVISPWTQFPLCFPIDVPSAIRGEVRHGQLRRGWKRWPPVPLHCRESSVCWRWVPSERRRDWSADLLYQGLVWGS